VFSEALFAYTPPALWLHNARTTNQKTAVAVFLPAQL